MKYKAVISFVESPASTVGTSRDGLITRSVIAVSS